MSSLVFHCPITLDRMIDPVKAPDGHSYERSAIVEAIRVSGVSPLTRQPMTAEQLITDYTLKTAMDNMDECEQVIQPVITASVCSLNTVTQLSVSTPDGEAAAKKVVFVIDISGSMATEVVSSTGETDGYSVLDVVKHGLLTCIMAMRDCDKVCIVTYSTEARVVFQLRKMDSCGRGLARVALAAIHSENSTNIWSGLNLALTQLPTGGTVFLLTDGQPNVSPPRGEVHMLKAALDGRNDIILNTYGFGYNLNSELLVALARTTQGSYAFIPDIGMVGTVFIHAIANLQTTVASSLTVSVETEGEITMQDAVKTSWGYAVPIGQLRKGQTRTLSIHCDQPVHLSILDIDIVQEGNYCPQDSQRAADGILKCHQLAKRSAADATDYLNHVIAQCSEPLIIEDLNDQVRKGITDYQRWGRHYLPSLAFAHLTQQCNNFMDKGIQDYGGDTFREKRDSLDTMFNKLPAPTPTHHTRSQQQGRPVQMSSYNNRAGPCFAGWNRVTMADNSTKECQHIIKGDTVFTSLGVAQVRCVVKTICKDGQIKLVNYKNLMVTPWHPIYILDQWDFPIYHGKAEDTTCEAVYSFLLEPHFQDMTIENVQCITLAHGIQHDNVATHPFYGTDTVVDMLQESSHFQDGCVELEGGNCLIIDADTNLVCGLRFQK